MTVQPSGQKALLSGDNSPLPPLEFVEDTDEVRPGDRVVTSGDGGGVPGGASGRAGGAGNRQAAAVVLAADYQRLEFLRVLRSHELEPITDPGSLVAPRWFSRLPDGIDRSRRASAGRRPARRNRRRRCRGRQDRARPTGAGQRGWVMVEFWRSGALGLPRPLSGAGPDCLLFVRLLPLGSAPGALAGAGPPAVPDHGLDRAPAGFPADAADPGSSS